MKPPFTFQVFLDGRSSPLFFDVAIYRSSKDLNSQYRNEPLADAFFRPSDKNDGVAHRAGLLAFHLNYLTHGVVAHEAAHAIIHWSRVHNSLPTFDEEEGADRKSKVGLPVLDNEELFATLVGSVVSQISMFLIKNKLCPTFHQEELYFL